MTLLERIVQVLQRYPGVRFIRDRDEIDVPPATPEGFHVSLSTRNGGRFIQFEGWHEELETDDEALDCFMSALTPAVRLRVVRRGNYDCKWTAEFFENGRWESVRTVALLVFPFWRRKREAGLQNRWIENPPRPR